ncbi:MAG: ActR/PrrA/RegA family redox response regulator transcription factor [Rhizobiales bacterium]|nr:ActR/PrrA/RegA family redox response regulator transcription factor [Hyphomicrobiales bacterium]
MDGHTAQSNDAFRTGDGASHPSLLIVDDDRPFLARLAKAMETRGYRVTTAGSVDEGMSAIVSFSPDFAIIDVRLGDGNGLDVVAEIKRRHPETRSLVLTGYGNIASAVSAIKRGAFDYLAKPADADEIDAALHGGVSEKPVLPENLMSADRVRWEHIQRIYEMCGRNVSETARRLNMHRRTLQRILAKRAPK